MGWGAQNFGYCVTFIVESDFAIIIYPTQGVRAYRGECVYTHQCGISLSRPTKGGTPMGGGAPKIFHGVKFGVESQYDIIIIALRQLLRHVMADSHF